MRQREHEREHERERTFSIAFSESFRKAWISSLRNLSRFPTCALNWANNGDACTIVATIIRIVPVSVSASAAGPPGPSQCSRTRSTKVRLAFSNATKRCACAPSLVVSSAGPEPAVAKYSAQRAKWYRVAARTAGSPSRCDSCDT